MFCANADEVGGFGLGTTSSACVVNANKKKSITLRASVVRIVFFMALLLRLYPCKISVFQRRQQLCVQAASFSTIIVARRRGGQRSCGWSVRMSRNASRRCRTIAHPGRHQVRLVSGRGEAILPAFVSERVRPGELFTSFHSPPTNVNALLSLSADERSKCPDTKCRPLRVEKYSTSVKSMTADLNG